jgi:hemerythrin-like domain-containing protein
MISQRLREEHQHLLPGIERLRQTGDLIGEVSLQVAKEEVEGVLAFLEGRLIPHAQAEDAFLYPALGRLMGSPRATLTMSRDHVEVGVLTGQLERALEEADVRMLRRLLYGLYHLIRLHFAKEEEIYIPLLNERLSPTEAEELFQRMHAPEVHAH